MKPELVFPVILASYSEDKIAMELLNNDPMIKTAWKLGNIGKFFSGSKAKPKQRQLLVLPKELRGEAEESKALPLLQKLVDVEKRMEKIRNEPLLQNFLDDLVKEQTEISNKLKAMGFNPNTLDKIKTIPLDELEQFINTWHAATSGMQTAGVNPTAGAANPIAGAVNPIADAANLANAVQATDTNQTVEAEDKNKGSSLLSKIMTAGGITGATALAYAMGSSNRDEQRRKTEETLAGIEAANNQQKKPMGLNRDRRDQSDQGTPAPKTEINPLLAAGLGALLIGGLAQRNYDNDEGQYNSLNKALLPILAGSLVGYGGAEAINRYV